MTAAATADLPILTRREKVLTMVGTLLGLLLAALDQTIVATAGPRIQVDLRIDPGDYHWLTTSYLVAGAVMLPMWGKLSDLLGRKRILLAGIGIFLLGSVLCGVAWGALPLIVARAVQGAGSSALFVSAFAVVADLFAPAERGKYQGIFGSVFALSSVVGPLIGGFLTDHASWHWIFFVNLPVGVVAVGFIALRMPNIIRATGPRRPIDVAGALALVVFVVPLLVGLSVARATPPAFGGPRVAAVLGVLSVVGLLLFLAVERRAADPLVDLGMFRDRIVRFGTLAAFLTSATFLAAIVFLPLFMVNVAGLSATGSGLTLIPLTAGIVGGNIGSGQIVARLGRYRSVLLAALVILIVGFAILGFTLTPASTQGELTWKMVVVGLGLGPTVPLFTLAVQNAVPGSRIGVATSTVTFARQMGTTIGVAVLGAVFALSLAGSGIDVAVSAEGAGGVHVLDGAAREVFTTAVARVHQAAMGIAIAALVVTLLLPDAQLRHAERHAPVAE